VNGIGCASVGPPAGAAPGKPAGVTVGEILRTHACDYIASRGGKVPAYELRVMQELAACRTAALGGHVSECDHCGAREYFHHSCRNRHCPLCGGAVRARWLDRCREDLLPTLYYQTVFTLPQELRLLTLANPKVGYDLLFKATAETLQEVAATPKHLGAKIGVMLVLHTWGRSLQYHPHVHGVVPGGGLSPDGTRWIAARDKFFLPAKVLSRMFRGKFLAGLKTAWREDRLRLEGELASLADHETWEKWLSPVYRKNWNVFVEPPPCEVAPHPEAVFKYLARYVSGVAISNSRLEGLAEGRVTFHWKDYRQDGHEKFMTLSAVEFLRRFFQHLLPPGFVRIRHYGFLSMRQRTQALPLCRQLLKLAGVVTPELGDPLAVPALPQAAESPMCQARLCPVCGQGQLRVVANWRRPTLPELMTMRVWSTVSSCNAPRRTPPPERPPT